MKLSRESVPTTTQVTASFLENPMAVSITILKQIAQTRNAEQNLAQKDTPRSVNLDKLVDIGADAYISIQLQKKTA